MKTTKVEIRGLELVDRPYFDIFPYLSKVEDLTYLGYRQPFEVRDGNDWTMLSRVDTSGITGSVRPDSRLAKEMDWFYNQSLIDLGNYSIFADEDVLSFTRSLWLDVDNHDGFLFRVAEVGNFLFIHTDDLYLLFIQNGGPDSKVALKYHYGFATVEDAYPV